MMLNRIDKIIGNTPLIKLENKDDENIAEILVKIESVNPGGSIKDRPALFMIEDAEKNGLLKEGGTIIEPTSGNTGIAISMIGAAKGYKVIMVMPETMSEERKKLMKAYGAELILTKGQDGMAGSVELAKELAEEYGYFMPNQFTNTNNVKSHYETTGKEILEDVNGKIDAFVAGVGTGGTISGVGRRLKEVDSNIIITAVEPEKSQLLSGHEPNSHKIEGIGANFIPEILDRSIIDRIIPVTEEEAYLETKNLGKEYGILCGISSGANLVAAKRLARELGKGKRVVTVLPDTGERYLSRELFNGE